MLRRVDDLLDVTMHHGYRDARPLPGGDSLAEDYSVAALRHLFLFLPVLEDAGFVLQRQVTYDPDWDRERTYSEAADAMTEQILNASLDQIRDYDRHFNEWVRHARKPLTGVEASFVWSKLSPPTTMRASRYGRRPR